AEFARDIPRGQMMKVAAVMEPANGATEGPALHPGMTLDAALASFVPHLSAVPVTDGDGKLVGQVTPEALVKALGAEAP
ncbi:MAG: CBS domain-containing protein, partial [Pseudomonadota bacterium]